jgi:hypothetical protein
VSQFGKENNGIQYRSHQPENEMPPYMITYSEAS